MYSMLHIQYKKKNPEIIQTEQEIQWIMILVKTSRTLISEIWKVKNKISQDHADMNIYKYYLFINVCNESSVLKRNKEKYYFVLYLKILSIG